MCPRPNWCVVSDFRNEVAENCTLLAFLTDVSGQPIGPIFKGQASKKQRVVVILGTTGMIVCPETSLRNYHFSLRNSPEQCSYHSLVCVCVCVFCRRSVRDLGFYYVLTYQSIRRYIPPHKKLAFSSRCSV